MGTRRTTFDKLQRERAKKAKAAANRENRLNKPEIDEEAAPIELGAEYTTAELLDRIEAMLHQRFEAKTISFEEFEEQKTELFERLAALPMD